MLVIDHYCFVSELPSVSLATQELTAVSEKWEYIGEEVGVEQSSLWHISTNHSDPGDCLREVLKERLRNFATTWGDIIAVLRSPRIRDFQLADILEAKYYPSESLSYNPDYVSLSNMHGSRNKAMFSAPQFMHQKWNFSVMQQFN